MRGREKGLVKSVRLLLIALEMYRRERFDVGTSHFVQLHDKDVWSVARSPPTEQFALTADGHDGVHHAECEMKPERPVDRYGPVSYGVLTCVPLSVETY